MSDRDLETLREEILDPRRGYSLVRGFYSVDDIDEYRVGCEAFIPGAPVINTHLVNSTTPNYLYPQILDRKLRGFQIYQFPQNYEGTRTEAFFQKTIELRDEVESGWADAAFRQEVDSHQIYAQVNCHYQGNRPAAKHRDFDPSFPKPVLQCWVPLTQPGRDYRDGNLVLYSKDGRPHRIEDELGVNKGDLLMFDKSLLHEAEVVSSTGNGNGLVRWNVVIGARQPPDSRLRFAYRKLLFTEPLWSFVRVTRPLRTLFKRAIRLRADRDEVH